MEDNIYPEGSAVIRATSAVMTVSPDDLLEEIEERFRKQESGLDTFQYVYVLDDDRKLLGVLSMRDILSNPPKTSAKEVMSGSFIHVSPETDQEEAAIKALRKKIKAIPVLKEDGTFMGVLTARTLFEILLEEHSEDLLHIGGVQKIYSASAIIKSRIRVLVSARLPWLLIGLAGGFLAALAVESFEEVLQNYIVLAFFLPLVVYMSDAVAGQTITIFIRAMALDHSFSVWRYVFRELGLGLLLASIMGVLLASVSLLWFADPGLSLVLGIALFLSVLVAVSIALFMTIFLDFLKKDPAVGSGPFATIIIDIVTIFIYFMVAKSLMPVFVA